MSLKAKILEDLKTAMKAKDQDRLRVLRSLKAKMQEKEIAERKGGEAELTDAQATDVLMKAAKQRKESITQFEEGDRADLADNEKLELAIIEEYLPKMMDEDEVRAVVQEKIAAMGASGPQDMGKVMGPIMGQLKGKADGGLVSKVVKEELNK
ncbi:GatB/YqeY domain-containing protein [Balneola vulgaris]|uniref:GatB/YqeY domain-containing protein n=1 Tax=Balneola vulgaris TaxID=287535 RepID=UPI000375CD4D|nr:GatB/YqeY domain-containing protein [Balneola vulgaris]